LRQTYSFDEQPELFFGHPISERKETKMAKLFLAQTQKIPRNCNSFPWPLRFLENFVIVVIPGFV
jgi:hypothetical protein